MSPQSFTTTYAGSKTTFQNASSQANQSSSYAHANSATRGTTYNAKAAQQIFQMPNQYDLSKSSDLTATLWVDNSLGSIFSDVGRGIGSGAKTFVKNTGKLGRDMVYHAADFYTFGYIGSKFPAVRAATQRQNEISSSLFTGTAHGIAHPVDSAKSVNSFVRSGWRENFAMPYEQGDYQTLSANATSSVLLAGSVWYGGGASAVSKAGGAATKAGTNLATRLVTPTQFTSVGKTAAVGAVTSSAFYLGINRTESTPAGLVYSAGVGSVAGLFGAGLAASSGVAVSTIPTSWSASVIRANQIGVSQSLGLAKSATHSGESAWNSPFYGKINSIFGGNNDNNTKSNTTNRGSNSGIYLKK